MPLSPGHILITTRQHREKISDVTDSEARELGSYVSLLSRALANVTGVWDWNIVQNNGAAASPGRTPCALPFDPEAAVEWRGEEQEFHDVWEGYEE